MFILDWIVGNWPEIVGAATAGFAFAVAVAKLTPTTADDELLANLYAKFGALSAFLPLPKITDTAKAIAVADKAAAKADAAAADAAAKAEVAAAKVAEKSKA
jgi:hypothetical protein